MSQIPTSPGCEANSIIGPPEPSCHSVFQGATAANIKLSLTLPSLLCNCLILPKSHLDWLKADEYIASQLVLVVTSEKDIDTKNTLLCIHPTSKHYTSN